jgi:putative ABC transport system ATP-binding protein
MSDTPIIHVKDLKKIYHVGDVDVPALRGATLDVKRGEFVAIVGPSGSGKSTLFHILGGLTPATSGTVMIDGLDVSKLTDSERTEMRRSKVAFVFQKYNLLPTLSALANIDLARYFAKRSGDTGRNFQEILKALGIQNRLHHKPRALSGGEQQRVAIARALVNEPAILLADEPTGNLDTENSTTVLSIMREVNQRVGQTILMITHNPEAAAFSDRTIYMRDGKVVV